MKKLKASIGIVLVCLFSFIGSPTFASEKEYESNGQTSFYGTYEFDTEDGKGETGSNMGNNAGGTVGTDWENTGSNDYSATGQSMLPNTGYYTDSVYSKIGSLLILIVTGFIYLMNKRKKGEQIL